MIQIFTIILLLFIGSNVRSQDRAVSDYLINLGFGTSYLGANLGLTLENRITDRSAIEFYAFKGFGLGYKFYIIDPASSKIGIYTGLNHYLKREIRVIGLTEVPVGIYYLSNSGFQIGFDVSLTHPNYFVNSNDFQFNNSNKFYIDYSIKVGRRFGGVSQSEQRFRTLHALLVEAGGATIDYAIHYDMCGQINDSPVKIALAPGFYYGKRNDMEQLLFPLNLTIMAGGDLNGEIGFTIPMGYFGEKKGYSENNFMIYSFPYVGARYQKRTGGLVVKAGVMLIQNERFLNLMEHKLDNYSVDVKGRDQLPWPSLSLGYTIRK